jgi:predicted DNA-binding protein YlxM (UPF0122 family)
MKLTVSEYATEFKTSVQNVYQRIKRGSLNWVEENGVKYVIVEDTSSKDDLKPKVDDSCKELLKLIKSQQKEIKRLTKELSKVQFHSMATMKGYIDKLEAMQQLPSPVPDEDIIEVKEKKKKRSNKR